MTVDLHASSLRRYVLGAATDHEAAAIERAYFDSAEALEEVRAAEVDLIDDYVSGQLTADERHAFQRRYLTTPARRQRIAVARALGNAATARSNERKRRTRSWRVAALAAASVVLLGTGAWFLQTRTDSPSTSAGATRAIQPPAPGNAPASEPAPRPAPPAPDFRQSDRRPIVATLEISPILLRGSPASTVIIGAGTDVVRLRLRGDAADPSVTAARAVVRTVGGREIWRGTATDARRPDLAHVEIPAARLRSDDYIVELFGTDTAGRAIELHRYFLSVRAP